MTARALNDAERADWLRLARTTGVGPVTFAGLIGRYGDAAKALEALPKLSTTSGRKRKVVIPAPSVIERELDAIEAFGAELLCAGEPGFPAMLSALSPPPPVLIIKGQTSLLSQTSIGMVGARNASAAGRKIARDMAADIGRAGHVVVSGLARGIDGEAHAASLKTGTIAVLGGGVDHVYPPQHEALYHALASDGLIVSESPMGYRATARDFPRRNRFISGLSRGLVVVEASERSGSLITARMAAEQGREVMAVPGSPLDPRAAGTNRLLKDGAHLVVNGGDVLDVMSGLSPLSVRTTGDGSWDDSPDGDQPSIDQLTAVQDALSFHPMPVEEIARAADMGVSRCLIVLVELELDGIAVTFPGGLAALAPPTEID